MTLNSVKKGSAYDLWAELGVDEDEMKRLSVYRRKKEPHFEKAVKLPHPGQSYNPALEDHQKLLDTVVKKEIKYLRKEENLKHSLVPKVSVDELNRDEHNELVSGIEHLIPKPGDDKAISNEDEDEDDEEYVNDYNEADFDAMLEDRVVQEKRKTTAQRMRQLRDKLQRKHAKLRKIRNIRLNKFNSIKKIKKQLDELDRLRLLKKRSTKRRLQRFAQKFERSDPIFCLPSELPSNLRTVKCPVDAMIRERMESFQARNLVEPTSLQMRRVRYPRKKFERRDATNKISDDLEFEEDGDPIRSKRSKSKSNRMTR